MIWVPTESLVFKISGMATLCAIHPGDWDIKRRVRLDETDKHRSMYQRFVEGKRWEDTDCFTKLYVARFNPKHSQEGARGYQEKLAHYRKNIEEAFKSLKKDGFRTDVDLPVVVIGREGEIMLGNQGNHRVAMAKILGIERIPVEVAVRHLTWNQRRRRVYGHPDQLTP